MSIWKKKPIAALATETAGNGHGPKRTLTVWSLIALGIGAVIGSGLFVSTASAIANNAGPNVLSNNLSKKTLKPTTASLKTK